jgi:exodeoxyribonuclease V alpha subunit
LIGFSNFERVIKGGCRLAGYAITIHKPQGSEFPAVVIPLATQHYMLLQRNLIYTGITPGKRLMC